VFPFAIGGTSFAPDTVCGRCNHQVNRDVETPALPMFRVFQSLHGIRGRRGAVPSVPAKLTIEGRDVPISLNERGEPPEAVVCVEIDEHGRKRYVVYGRSEEAIRAKFEEISAKRPGVQWSEGRENLSAESTARTPFEPSDIVVRRLAVKIAFERFAQFIGATVAAGSEFDDARDFILTGKEREPCCGVLADSRLLNGALDIPVPTHAVVLIGHPADRIMGGFVVFFGLFYYWIILSRRYSPLAPLDDLMAERPIARDTYIPPLRARPGSVRVPWAEVTAPYLQDPNAVCCAAVRHAGVKFRAAVDEFYGEARS
jgi:hypothetical protein